MAMEVNITNEAYNDIATFYDNVMIAHPNTFDINDAARCINEVYDGITSRINGIIGNEREPLLQTLNNGNTIELSCEKRGRREWYFTLRFENGIAIVDNAWYYVNASNRAHRRGVSNPNAPLTQDDRSNQIRRTITEHKLRNIIRKTLRRVLLTP